MYQSHVALYVFNCKMTNNNLFFTYNSSEISLKLAETLWSSFFSRWCVRVSRGFCSWPTSVPDNQLIRCVVLRQRGPCCYLWFLITTYSRSAATLSGQVSWAGHGRGQIDYNGGKVWKWEKQCNYLTFTWDYHHSTFLRST